MKKILFILSIFFLFVTVISCEKESEGLSIITYYVEIDLDGGSTVAIPLGSEYEEPGFTAMEGENEVTDQVEVSSNVNASEIGVYQVNYEAVNADGFSSSTSRTVVVYDPTAPEVDLSGTYNTSIVRTEADGSSPRSYSAQMTVTKQGTGVFYVSCLLGGTYSIGFGYGPAYAMTGYINLNSDYSISMITSFVQGWGDSLENFKDATYNPETGNLEWVSVYAGADNFAVTGTK